MHEANDLVEPLMHPAPFLISKLSKSSWRPGAETTRGLDAAKLPAAGAAGEGHLDISHPDVAQ